MKPSIAKMSGFFAGVLLLCSPFTAGPQDPKPVRDFELRADSPEFWNLIPKQSKLETVATGFGFTEGPVWDESGFLYVSDEEMNKIFRLYPDRHKEELISLGDPDGNTYDRELRLLDCASVLRAIIRISVDGKYTVLADRYQGKRFNSPTMSCWDRTAPSTSRTLRWIFLQERNRKFRFRVSIVLMKKARSLY